MQTVQIKRLTIEFTTRIITGNYPSNYYYNSQFYHTSWPVHNSHYYGYYGNLYNQQSTPMFQKESANVGQRQRLSPGGNSLKNGVTAQESISAGIKLAGQTVDETTRDALDGIVKKYLRTSNCTTKIRNLQTVFAKKIWLKFNEL